MKTKQLAPTLRALNACSDGIHMFLRHPTVEQWWFRCKRDDHKVWLWLAILAVYPDNDVLFEDVKAMIRLDETHRLEVLRSGLLWERRLTLRERMNYSGFISVYAYGVHVEYRCPHDRELQHLINEVEKENNK